MGAGLLPVAIYKNMLIFLMGKERNSMLWCDFGGSKEKGETYFQTALREGYEESDKIIGSKNNLYINE